MPSLANGEANRPQRHTSRAVKALLKHCTTKDPIYLQLTLKTSLTERRSVVPVLIRIPHAIHGDITTLPVLFIVKDPQSKYQEALEDNTKSPTHGMFTEIVSVTRLKARLRSEGRSYFDSFELIVVEDKVASVVAPILGQKFYKSGKSMPIPVATKDPNSTAQKLKPVDAKLVHTQMKRILKCTSLAIAPGTCLSLLVGYGGMGAQQVQENTDAALDLVVNNVLKGKDGWGMITGAHVKSPDSAALPLWTSK